MTDSPADPKKKDVSRRNFLAGLAGLAIASGIVVAGAFGVSDVLHNRKNAITSTTTSSTEGSLSSTGSLPVQQIESPATGLAVKTSDLAENESVNFVYPRSTDPTLNQNTFAQFVLIHLPKGFTAPGNLGVVDNSSGDTFIALSRVCVHLWCLCSYNASSDLLVCPCHGSQFVPGDGPPYNDIPGTAISGPAASQPAPNNTLPVAILSIAEDGTISATGIVGQVGCGQKCSMEITTATSVDGA